MSKKARQKLLEQENRNDTYETDHQKHIKCRKEYLEKLKKKLHDNITINTVVAARYRDLKYKLYSHKLCMMRKIEIKLDKIVSLNDKRQVKVLQERLHTALKDYNNYKS